MRCLEAGNPVAYLLRRLGQQTNLGHTQGLTQVRGATSWKNQAAEDFELVDSVIVTCSKDGTAGIWTCEFGAFRLLCFLMHVDKDDSMVTVNDAAAYLDEEGGYLHVLTGSADGCTRLWSFKRSTCPGLPYEHFADKEDSHGIAQRLEPEAAVHHTCELCKTNHAVLSLAVLPVHERQGAGAIFNFVVGTAKGAAEVYSVRRASASLDQQTTRGFEIVPLKGQGDEIGVMKHSDETSIYSLAVTRDFLRKNGAAQLVATCDGLGLTKLWRLELQGETCSIEHLRTYVHQESGKAVSLRCVKFTPSFEITDSRQVAPRYLVTSCFNVVKQERSRIFVWSLQELADHSTLGQEGIDRTSSMKAEVVKDPETGEWQESDAKRSYVFRANNIAFWYPRDTGAAITLSGSGFGAETVEQYVYCITSAPDCSAKMFKLINMNSGTLTLPLLKDQRLLSLSSNSEERDKVAADDLATIVSTYRLKAQVQAVLAVRMREEVETDTSSSRAGSEYRPLTTETSTADAWYMVAAGGDGSANIWDPFTGQGMHRLRSASMPEMYLPLLLQLLTTCQLIAFSLDESVPWNQKMVAGPRCFANILILDSQTVATPVNIKKDELFLVAVVLSALGVALFMVIVIFDTVGKEQRRMLDIEVSEQYRKEVKRGQTGLTAKSMGPAHRRYRRSMLRLRFWRLVIWACPMVALVPMVKSIVRFFDCNSDPSHEPSYYVARAEWMPCYQGVHLGCALPLAMLLVPFLVLTLPFRAVSGDASVVARADLWDPKQWRRNAVQKTAQTDLGPMQMEGRNQFLASAVETFAKVAAPVSSILLTSHVVLRAASLCAIHLVLVTSAMVRPTHATPSINTLFVGIKFIGLWVSLFAVIAIGEVADARLVMWCLYGVLFLHGLVVMCIYARQYKREHREYTNFRVLMAKELDSPEAGSLGVVTARSGWFSTAEDDDEDDEPQESQGRCGCI